MKKFLILNFVLGLLIQSAYAHVEIGEYRGVDSNKQNCSFQVKSVVFLKGIKHPLNERVEILVGTETLTLQHLPVINFDALTVEQEKEVLTGTSVNDEAKLGVVLKMDHSNGHDGPSVFSMVTDNFSDPSLNKKLICSDLVFVSGN